MLSQRNRLSLALMLQSRLESLKEGDLRADPAKASLMERLKGQAPASGESCYICGKIRWAMDRMVDNLLRMYSGQQELRELFAQQEKLCYPHYKLLMERREGLDRKYQKQFCEKAEELVRRELDTLYQDVSHFCNMFDYRNSGLKADWGSSRDSIERAIGFLTGDTGFVEKTKSKP